ncbi:hypothetical protein A3B35_00295 [Candidatus Kaiserbacteria bacterium RIFCSPLOWO2_01_FULL_54_24]|uniref:Bacterial spore germination immunoglobulin-like domain-containing protein n=1 Tax=Candidatus Kaiserbacteria bacterium RIFCSPLOWO2_01_FULL_54_24 TaxID=1798515 RepID=A0A1F6EUV7_9BACT|nr:MAG: hypothetical protein A3B35_00295 [Candidatus Kaiserbacteria bacterium RIFCSPLOWO2_01_FULL_54_24]
MNLRITIALVVLLVVVILGAVLIAAPMPANGPKVDPQEDTQFVSENVKVSSPRPNAVVLKTFTVIGEARGTWYFEASFPIFVIDANGAKVGQGIAQAVENWMTEDFVPFTAQVTVENYSGPATLVLLKDNPSGLPENDDSVSFSIVIQ